MSTLSFWQHFDSSTITQATINTYAPRLGIVVFNAWESHYISQFKAVNPNLKCWVYKDYSSTRTSDPGPNNETSGALLYSTTHTNHPSWFMTQTGADIQWAGFPGVYQMDIGNSAYQNAAAAAVIADVQANGWDGVFMDNILYSLTQYNINTSDQYTTDTQFQNAYISLLTNVCAQMTAAGIGSMGNMAGIRLDNPLWETYMACGQTGGFDQFWLDFSANTHGVPEFGTGSGSNYVSNGFIAQISECNSNVGLNKIFMGQTQSQHTDTSTQGFRYSFAGYNLVAAPALSMFAENTNESGPPFWRPEYNYNLGNALGAYTQPKSLVYQRQFSAGMAIANANASGSPVTITLPATYVDEDGNVVTSVTLSPEFGTTLQLQGGGGGGGPSTFTPLAIPELPNIYAGYTMQPDDFDDLTYACEFLMTKPMTRAYDATGGQVVNVGLGSTVIVYTQITFDIDGMYNPAFPDRLTIQTPGWYKLRYGVNCGTSDVKLNAFAILSAGPNNPSGPGTLNMYGTSANSAPYTFMSAAGIIPAYLYTGDFVQVGVRCYTGQTAATSVAGYQSSNDAGSYLCLEYVSTT